MFTAKWTHIRPVNDDPPSSSTSTSTSSSHRPVKPCSRSSHGLSMVHNGTCLILYGGEHVARTPLDSTQSTWAAELIPPSDCSSSTDTATATATATATSSSYWKWRLVCERKEDTCPPPRVAHAQASIGNKVYIFGGRVGIEMNEKGLNDMWVLDCTTKGGKMMHDGDDDDDDNDNDGSNVYTWSEVLYDTTPTDNNHSITSSSSNLPPCPRSFHQMISIGTNLYVFGGCSSSHGKDCRLKDLYVFNTLTNRWTELDPSPLLRGRGGANLIHFPTTTTTTSKGKDENDDDDNNNNNNNNNNKGKLGIIAGFCGEETNDAHYYHLSTHTWEEQLIQYYSNPHAKDVDEKVEEGEEKKLIREGNPNNNNITLRPRSVCVSGTISSLHLAFIFGGEVNPSDRGHEGAGGFENDIALFDTTTDSGSSSNSNLCQVLNDKSMDPTSKTMDSSSSSSSLVWPTKRGWSDGATYKQSFYVFGGLTGDDENPTRLDDLWQCEFIPKN